MAGTEAQLHVKCHLGPFSRLATNQIDMGRKLGALPPFWGGELGYHLTQNVATAEAYLHASFILIHPTVCHITHTNVTDRTDRQDIQDSAAEVR